jgi:hypothetical protein
MRRRGSIRVMVALSMLCAMSLTACGDDDKSDTGGGAQSEDTAEGSDTIQIEYLDYAYQVSGPLTAGGTIEFRNAGKEMHMMYVGKLKAGKKLSDVQTLLETAEEAEENPLLAVMDEIGIPWNMLTPGLSAAVTAPKLAPGNYAILCFLPTEGSGEPHFAKGMVNEFTVVEGDVEEPTADVTYKIAAGQAPDGPKTLSAGEHTVRFEQVGDAAELEPNIGRLDAGKTFQEVDAQFESLFGGENPPPKGAAEGIPADVFIGGDFLTEPYYFVTMDFVAGNYVIVAEDSEDEDETSPPKELLEVTVS